MAEKETINIVDLQIKEEDVVRKLSIIKKLMDETKESTKQLEKENEKIGDKLSKPYKENAIQIEKNKAQVKGLSTEYRNNQTILVSLNKDHKNNLKSINDLIERNKALRQERNRVDITTEKGQKRLKDLNAEIDKNDKLIKDNNDNLIKQKINIGNYSSALDGLPGPIGGAVTGFKALTKSALAFIATPIGAVIAALVGLFKLFQAAVKNSQPLMDKLNAAGAAFSATFKVIIDRVSNFAEKIVAAFEDPKTAVTELWETIKQNFINRFQAIPKLAIAVGKTIKSALKLNFEEAGEAAEEAGQAFIQMTTGLDEEQQKKVADAVNDVATEIKNEAKETSNLTNQQQALRDAEIDFIKRKAELNKEAREALTLSKNQQLSDEERIKYLQEYLDKINTISEQEVKFAEEKARIARAQLEQGKSLAEGYENVYNLEAEADRLRAELAAKQGEAISQLSGLQKTLFNERMAQINATIAAERKAVEEEIALRQQANDLFNEIDAEQADEFLKSLELNEQNKLELLNQSIFGQIEAERQKLETQKQMEIEAAEAIGADVNLINQKYAKLETDLNKKTLDAKLDLASQAFGNLAQIFGENTKAAKAASAAQTTIETIKGAIQAFNAFTTVGGPIGMILGGIAAAAVTASGVKAVRDIYAVKSGLPGDSAGGGSSLSSVRVSGISGGTSSANINDGGVVGRSMGMKSIKEDVKNGFSEALKENPLQPTLVVDEVTSKQTESKYIVNTATI